MEPKLNRSRTNNENQTLSNEAILEKYRISLISEKKSELTIKKYTSIIRDLLSFLKNKPVNSIDYTDLNSYRTYLVIDKKYSKNSLYLVVQAIHNFFSYLQTDTARDLRPPKRPQSSPKYLSEEEAHAILEAAAKASVRDYAILTLLSYSGMRVSELCNLTLDSIDFNSSIVFIKSGKGDKDRIVVVEEKTLNALKEYLKTRKTPKQNSNTDIFFVSQKEYPITPRQIQRLVKKYSTLAGIRKKVTPHVLRHTLATTLLKHGADIRIIQKILGHSSIATTQIYTHVDEETLKEVYFKTKPKY